MPKLTQVTVKGRTYYWTGKLGTNIQYDLPVAEYEDSRHWRVWVTMDGSVVFPD